MDSLPTCLLFLLAFNGILGKAGLKSYVTSLSFAGQGCLAVSVATQSDFTVCVHAGPRSISWGDEARSSSAFFTLLPDLCTAGAPERMRWGPWSSLFIRTLPSFCVWSRLWFAERWPLGGCPSPSRPPGAGCPQELRLPAESCLAGPGASLSPGTVLWGSGRMPCAGLRARVRARLRLAFKFKDKMVKNSWLTADL